jgi:hypothetical protein
MPVDVRTSLSEAILGLDRLLEKKKMRGLLVLDEFQEITAIDKAGANSLEAEFRTVVQSAGCLSFDRKMGSDHGERPTIKDVC